ncbi:protein COFACTOR ASSEMBLY OF COMPLEX C SUBUNIT B CCB4, chloroplastic isoform X2 [Musa acuminata AAA Group]|uniref:protein COFACTOR ASSEMBLY OF COMPLEX C SUBUNIT B CCB4, chloroplastic isoform X2 n=1 Tax=Musa acuminata AAA Group TaxID=214697 RepID=UPI0031CFE73F
MFTSSPSLKMEVIGCLFSRRSLSAFPILPPRSRRCPFQSPSLVPLMMSSSPSSAQEAYKGPRPRRDLVGDWVSNNNGLVRSLPIYVGGVSLLVVLLNRAFSGIALVTDASSSQSRADILTLSLSVTNLLTGLVWLSIRPKYVSPVIPCGVECMRINSDIADLAIHELRWVWESLSSTTCCRSLVVIYGGNCFLQIGIAAESQNETGVAMVVDVHKLLQGSLCRSAIGSGKQSYLANLSLYPGRSELPFLPSNTQSVILQPLGDRGIAIVGGDIIRGFTNLDQAWITLIAEKLDATLSEL